MPGYNPTALNYKVRNANGVSILIGDQVVGFGQSSNPGQDYGTEGMYGIGSAKPQEVQQLKFSMTITLDSFQLTDEGIAFFGLTADIGDILTNNSFNIFLLDNKGLAWMSYVGCVAVSRNMTIPANQIVTEAMTFMAMDVLGRDGKSVLNSNGSDIFNPLASATAIPVIVPGG